MKLSILFFSLFIFYGNAAFADSEVGKVLVVKGDAFIKGKDEPLRLGSQVSEGDVLETKGSTLLKVRFIDNTLISMGPNSIFKINTFKIKEGKRTSVFNFLRGKIRAHVKEKRKEGETIIFSNSEIALGVRGTEILANSYLVQGSPSTDVMLTKGAVNLDLRKLGVEAKSYNLSPGKAFNSNLVRQKGIGSISSIKSKSLELITSSDAFLPSLQNVDGSFVDVDKSISKSLGIDPDEPIDKKDSDAKKPEAAVSAAVVASTVKGLVAGGFKYNLKDEPWDIRDAVMNRGKYRSDDKCFYYFYKSIPGSGEYERFRRERECGDFENELD